MGRHGTGCHPHARVVTEHHATKAYWGSGGTATRILELGTRWRWVVSFTPRPLYPQGKRPWYPLDGRLGGPQNQCTIFICLRTTPLLTMEIKLCIIRPRYWTAVGCEHYAPAAFNSRAGRGDFVQHPVWGRPWTSLHRYKDVAFWCDILSHLQYLLEYCRH
jgi:hypothetical protein